LVLEEQQILVQGTLLVHKEAVLLFQVQELLLSHLLVAAAVQERLQETVAQVVVVLELHLVQLLARELLFKDETVDKVLTTLFIMVAVVEAVLP
jgi:hypothetical protein